jgi:non-heme chloroperoxidase
VDRRPVLKEINRPALVIASAESPLLDAQKEMAGQIAAARLVVVEGAGHAVFLDDPEEFDTALCCGTPIGKMQAGLDRFRGNSC